VTDSATETVDLRSYLRPLRARWWIVVLIAVAVAAFSYAYYDRKPTTYSASTTLLLLPDAAEGGGGDSDRVVREQAVIIRTRAVARLVAEELGIPAGRGLPGTVSAGPSSGTDFLTLTSTSLDPRSAIDLVNAYARVYVSYSAEAGRAQARAARLAAERRLSAIPDTPQNRSRRQQLEAGIQTLAVQEKAVQSQAQHIEPALTATAISPSPLRNAIFGFVLGALLGLGIAYGLEHLDRRVRRVEEIGALYDRAVLVAVPGAPRAVKALRTLRTTLQLQATDAVGGPGAPLRTMLVTSAIPGEGKSTVARSLALAYFEAGLKVALVDADLRRPTVAEVFGLARAPGLAEVLDGMPLADALHVVRGASREEGASLPASEVRRQAIGAVGGRAADPPLQFPGPHRLPPQPPAAEPTAVSRTGASRAGDGSAGGSLDVLTSGKTPRDPAALLAGGPVGEVLRELGAGHDIVILDSSPLLPVSDAVGLLSAVEGVLLVSRIGVTSRDAVAQLTDLLDRVPSVNVLGVVANDVRRQVGHGYGAYGYS
jgi:polysaccharide biosynthesis transport protein